MNLLNFILLKPSSTLHFCFFPQKMKGRNKALFDVFSGTKGEGRKGQLSSPSSCCRMEEGLNTPSPALKGNLSPGHRVPLCLFSVSLHLHIPLRCLSSLSLSLYFPYSVFLFLCLSVSFPFAVSISLSVFLAFYISLSLSFPLLLSLFLPLSLGQYEIRTR